MPPEYLSDGQVNYRSQFGNSGLANNTYIYNNYYGDGSTNETDFLTRALIGSERRWSIEEDDAWRDTIQASYFENKVPEVEMVLPAAAVMGAATAFGLTSLFPLNVPTGRPLMYCNSSHVEQNPIRLSGRIYSCSDGEFVVSCPRFLQDDGSLFDNEDCSGKSKILPCDLINQMSVLSIKTGIYCKQGTLLRIHQTYCLSALASFRRTEVAGVLVTETINIIDCHDGQVHPRQASFITIPIRKMTEWEKEKIINDEVEEFPRKWVAEAMTIPENILEGLVNLENTTRDNFNSTEDFGDDNPQFGEVPEKYRFTVAR